MVGATYDDFVADLYSAEQSKECRYGLFDASYEGGAGMQKNKLLFFMWSVFSNTFSMFSQNLFIYLFSTDIDNTSVVRVS